MYPLAASIASIWNAYRHVCRPRVTMTRLEERSEPTSARTNSDGKAPQVQSQVLQKKFLVQSTSFFSPVRLFKFGLGLAPNTGSLDTIDK